LWPVTGSAILKVRKSYIDGAVNNERKHVLQHVVASHWQRNIEGEKIIHRWRCKIMNRNTCCNMWWPATGSAILKVRKSYIDGAEK
jgi:hypothetical protein